MAEATSSSKVVIRELTTIADLQRALNLEQEVWEIEDIDVMPLTLAVAARASGSLWLGAFDKDKDEMIGFAFALPSLEHGRPGFHSHTVAVRAGHRDQRIGYQLKLAQRERALARGIKEMTWTFDPLRSRNAHLNFFRLGVICNSYRVDFYGSQNSSPLYSNGTDRFWVTWRMADPRVEARLKGKDSRPEIVDALKHVDPLVRFNGDGWPAEADLSQALARQRIAIEIPGDIERIEHDDRELALRWRLATRRAFSESIKAGFVVTEFCRSIRGQQGPGAYLLERIVD